MQIGDRCRGTEGSGEVRPVARRTSGRWSAGVGHLIYERIATWKGG
jgi:hypothetical protein